MGELPWPPRLGKYDIERRLAFGGMAEVFLAHMRGADGFKKDVVIKRVLPQHSADPRFVEMFRYEAELTSRLQHGNIAQVIELGEEAGQFFLVLEYVRGASLRDVLGDLSERDEHLSVAEAAFIGDQICRALDYAHRKRGEDGKILEVVHRDVSPSNVLLSYEGQVKLTDFGVARARDRAEGSRTNTVKGKAEYLAPETILHGVVNARSDLFAVGALLWEMLVGRAVFGAESGVRAMFNVMNLEVEPPSSHNPLVSSALDELVLRLLEKEPSLRPARGLDVARALEPFEQTRIPPADLLADTLGRMSSHKVDRPSSAPSRSATTRTAAGRRVVLVVEQSATLRALLEAKLGQTFQMIPATSLAEARAVLAERSPHLVLCQRFVGSDVGLDLCRELKARARHYPTPFVLLAADPTDELRAEARDAGAQAVAAKSLNAEALVELCEGLLAAVPAADLA